MLVAIAIFPLIFRIGFSGFHWFQARARITNALRTITSAFNTARYQAIDRNRSVKICLEEARLNLKTRSDGEWKTFTKFDLGEKISASMNAEPVFLPTGFVSPLCSVVARHERYAYKITLSIAGRIKVTKIN